MPGSESADSDRTPSLFFRWRHREKLYVVLVQQQRIDLDPDQPRVLRRQREWSETIEVSGNIYSEKSAPRPWPSLTTALNWQVQTPASRACGPFLHSRVVGRHDGWREGDVRAGGVDRRRTRLDVAPSSPAERLRVRRRWLTTRSAARVAARLLSAPTVDAGSEPNAVVIRFRRQRDRGVRPVGAFDSGDGTLRARRQPCRPSRVVEPLRTVGEQRGERTHKCGGGRTSSHRSRRGAEFAAAGFLSPIATDVKDILVRRAASLCADGGPDERFECRQSPHRPRGRQSPGRRPP